jgi:dephospho-CoA kinase
LSSEMVQKHPPAVFISLNGPDGVGKTTQLGWLARGLPDSTILGSLRSYDPRWNQYDDKSLSRWWFIESTTEEHVDLLLSSLSKRRAGAQPGLNLLDRGTPLVLATCAATAVIKEGITVAAALATVRTLSKRYKKIEGAGDINFLMMHGKDTWEHQYARFEDPTYQEYQKILHTILKHQIDEGEYGEVIYRHSLPVIEVQNQIRRYLTSRLSVSIPLILSSVRTVWALAGLSEAGKSTVGEILQSHHGACRLKISYLIHQVSARLGASETQLYRNMTAAEMATEILIELEHFVRAHYYYLNISVESVHSSLLIKELKLLLGDQLQIAYISAPFKLRVERAGAPASVVRAKDRVKRSRGAQLVSDIADWRVENSGDPVSLIAYVSHMVSARLVPSAPQTVEYGSLPVPDFVQQWAAEFVQKTKEAFDSSLKIVALTGSGSVGDWVLGWSDLDVLIVADPPNLDSLSQILKTNSPSYAKLGCTMISTPEITSGILSAHVLSKLTLLAQNRVRALYCAPDYRLPRFERPNEVASTLRSLPSHVEFLRRLLLDPSSTFHQIYKTSVIVQKIILKARGVDTYSTRETVDIYTSMYPQNLPAFPPFQQVLQREKQPVNDPELLEQARGAANGLLTLYHRITTGSGDRT